MDLYKISYDARRPEMDALTITKDSKFAIQFQFVKDEYNYFSVRSDSEVDRPALRLKKADGTTTSLYATKHSDEISEGDGIYLWIMEEKFDSNVSCYIDYYQSYYNEETEEEWEKDIKDCCICQINCKDSSIAYNAVSQTPYTEATSIRAGKDSSTELYAVAMGYNAVADEEGVAVGLYTQSSSNGVAIGSSVKNTSNTGGVVIGSNSSVTKNNAVAIGTRARANVENSIQLGTGTLSANNVLMQVKEFPLLDKDGKIMQDRFPSNIGSAATPLEGLFFRDQQNNGKIWYLWIVDGQVEVNEYN